MGWREKRAEKRSKDLKINRDGERLIEFIEERGWSVFIGRVKGDEEGEYTFTGRRGNTVIDYVIESEEVRERILRLEVGEKIDSNHHPLEVVLKDEKIRNR